MHRGGHATECGREVEVSGGNWLRCARVSHIGDHSPEPLERADPEDGEPRRREQDKREPDDERRDGRLRVVEGAEPREPPPRGKRRADERLAEVDGERHAPRALERRREEGRQLRRPFDDDRRIGERQHHGAQRHEDEVGHARGGAVEAEDEARQRASERERESEQERRERDAAAERSTLRPEEAGLEGVDAAQHHEERLPSVAEERRDEAEREQHAAKEHRVEERALREGRALGFDPRGIHGIEARLEHRLETALDRRGGVGLSRAREHQSDRIERGSAEGVERHEHRDHGDDPAKRPLGEARARERDHTKQRIQREDVAVPDERPVHDADQREAREAPQARGPRALPLRGGAGGLHGEAEAKEQREQRDELEAAEGLDEGPRGAVGGRALRAIERDDRVHREPKRREEEADIDEQDAQQCDAAGDVHAAETLGGADWGQRHGEIVMGLMCESTS